MDHSSICALTVISRHVYGGRCQPPGVTYMADILGRVIWQIYLNLLSGRKLNIESHTLPLPLETYTYLSR